MEHLKRPTILRKAVIKNKFILKTIESFFGRVSFSVFSMFFSLVCTRMYGSEAFGEYIYAFTLVQFIMIFSKAGLDNGLIYYIPKYGNKYTSLSLVVNTIFSAFFILIGCVFIKDQFIKLMLPLIWLLSMESIFFSLYRADGKIREYYFINGFVSLLLRILLVMLFYFFIGKNVTSIALAVYISFIFSNLMYFFQNKDSFKKITFDKDFLKYSFALIFATTMGVIVEKIDIIMLGSMMTKRDVGIYQVAVQLANTLAIISAVFNTVFAPRISQLYHSGKQEELKRTYILSTRILGLVSLATLVILSALSKYILLFWGEEIIEGQLVLILKAIGQSITTAVGSAWLMLAMTGKSRIQMYGNLAALLINIFLNFLLIPDYGINGAAFASSIALAFLGILGYVLVSREFKVKVFGVI